MNTTRITHETRRMQENGDTNYDAIVAGAGVAMDCACAAGLICASEITGKDYGIK